MEKYQCATCGKFYETRNEAELCHANASAEKPKARKVVTCPDCGKIYQMGYNGVVAGCDECQKITRLDNGYVCRH